MTRPKASATKKAAGPAAKKESGPIKELKSLALKQGYVTQEQLDSFISSDAGGEGPRGALRPPGQGDDEDRGVREQIGRAAGRDIL